MSIAKQVGENSKCMSRKIGAVIVKNKCVVSIGYNGPVRGAIHCDKRNHCLPRGVKKVIGNEIRDICPRRIAGFKSGEGNQYCLAGHAERNAIVQSAMNGISTLGTSMYCWCPLPCLHCTICIINAGISDVYYFEGPDYDEGSRILFNEVGVNLHLMKDWYVYIILYFDDAFIFC